MKLTRRNIRSLIREEISRSILSEAVVPAKDKKTAIESLMGKEGVGVAMTRVNDYVVKDVASEVDDDSVLNYKITIDLTKDDWPIKSIEPAEGDKNKTEVRELTDKVKEEVSKWNDKSKSGLAWFTSQKWPQVYFDVGPVIHTATVDKETNVGEIDPTEFDLG